MSLAKRKGKHVELNAAAPASPGIATRNFRLVQILPGIALPADVC
jgi:hypothetical protein